jgi:phospholipid N-methyltransferase
MDNTLMMNCPLDSIKFVYQFLSAPVRTGAIAASSQGLANRITDEADLGNAKSVVEFGPGTGVFTEKIILRKKPETTFFAMEISDAFVEATRRRCPGATVFHDSVVNTRKYMEMIGVQSCDRIICGLPWASFPEALQNDILDTILDIMEPRGLFLTFAYLQGLLLPAGLRFRRKLNRSFSRVHTTRTVWKNLPPAFVYCARR